MLDINWNALYSFWLVAEHGSFAAAARATPHGTAQALFKRVKQLEDARNLNLKLFRSRGAKGVELTDAGHRLRRFVDPVFRSVDAIASDLRGEDSGSMVFAAVPYVAYNYGHEIIRHFHEAFPRVDLTVKVRPHADIIDLLEKGHADFGLCTPPRGGRQLIAGVSAPVPIAIIAPHGHRLTRGAITWKDVAREPLIVPARDTPLRLELERLLQHAGLLSKCRVAGEINETELAVESVRGGAGVAIIGVGPQLAAHLKGLVRIVPPPNLPKFEISLLHRADRYLPNYMKAFQRLVGLIISGQEGALALAGIGPHLLSKTDPGG
jgi:DNA-binding transcriptional LysR family regulator